MQIDEMCIFMQEGVDRTGSQAYTVSHGKQMTADQSREKGVQTNDGLSFRYDDDVHVHVAPAACASKTALLMMFNHSCRLGNFQNNNRN